MQVCTDLGSASILIRPDKVRELWRGDHLISTQVSRLLRVGITEGLETRKVCQVLDGDRPWTVPLIVSFRIDRDNYGQTAATRCGGSRKHSGQSSQSGFRRAIARDHYGLSIDCVGIGKHEVTQDVGACFRCFSCLYNVVHFARGHIVEPVAIPVVVAILGIFKECRQVVA